MWIVTILLVSIGAINWGLVGAFDFNLVSAIFGEGVVARVIYVLVGLAGLVSFSYLFGCGKFCGTCGKKESSSVAGDSSPMSEGGSM